MLRGSFALTPETLLAIHRTLLRTEDDGPNRFRTFDLLRRQPLLGNRLVVYTPYREIDKLLSKLFSEERHRIQVSNPLDVGELSAFLRAIWIVHPFCPGNARVLHVFMALYMDNLRIQPDTDTLENGLEYLRYALVRNNLSGIRHDGQPPIRYIERYVESLIGCADALPIPESVPPMEPTLDLPPAYRLRKQGMLRTYPDGGSTFVPSGPTDKTSAGCMALLDECSAYAVHCLSNPLDAECLSCVMAARWGIPPSEAEASCNALLEKLEAEGIVERCTNDCAVVRIPERCESSISHGSRIQVERFYANSIEADYSFPRAD